MATAKRLNAEGYPVMPHFPARIIPSKATLADWIARYQGEANVTQALLLGGAMAAGSLHPVSRAIALAAGSLDRPQTTGLTDLAEVAGQVKYLWLRSAGKRAAHGADEHAVQGHAHWAYQGENGPAHWHTLNPEFKQCGLGQRQSPIDIRGGLAVNGEAMQAGDAALIEGESRLTLAQGQGAEVLVFDLAP